MSCSSKQLAKAVGWNPKYLSGVLNGHYEPKSVETRLQAALKQLVEE